MFARKKNIKLRQQRVDILMNRMSCTNDDGSISSVPRGADTESESNVLSNKEQEERDRLIAERLSREFQMENKLKLTALRFKRSEGAYSFRRIRKKQPTDEDEKKSEVRESQRRSQRL